MFTRASVRGHPIHPMLVVFPIGLYVSGVAALLAYAARGDAFWYRAAFIAMLAGAALGAIAATFGIIDLSGVPRDTRARLVGLIHGTAAVTTTLLFASAGLVLWADWGVPLQPLPYHFALVLACCGLGTLTATGLLGWTLTGTHHVGISPIPGRGPQPLPKPLEHS